MGSPGKRKRVKDGGSYVSFYRTSYVLNIFNDSVKKDLLNKYFQSDTLAWKLHFLREK